MRPTRRGGALAFVAVLGFGLATAHGARSLNAVVLPAALALLAGLVQVYGLSTPRLERSLPEDGFPGDEGTVRLEFEAADPFVGVVTDSLPTGLEGHPQVATTVGAAPVEYEVRYAERGRHVVGPAEVVASDVLGLLERRFVTPGEDELVVYPDAPPLSPAAREELFRLHDPGRSDERDEFDRLREYVRGDPLRDVDWKATAKRDELIVTEYTARTAARRMSVVAGAEAAPGAGRPPAEEMAAAAASVCLTLLGAGVPITLRTPDGVVESDDDEGRRELLEHLASVGPGPVPDREAEVTVRATAEGTTVRFGDWSASFAEVTAAGGTAAGRAVTGGDGDGGGTARGDDPDGGGGNGGDRGTGDGDGDEETGGEGANGGNDGRGAEVAP